MITEKDIKALKQHASLSGTISSWMLVCSPIFFIIVGSLNIKMASTIGARIECNLASLFQGWINGIDATEQYSGIYLLAIERLTTGIIQISTASILAIMASTYWMIRKRDMRILETMRHHGIIKD